ncbi:unnamed protein product [Heterobilharzia americana]|nr:unnamed protein product [Heterobilharzia americana]
MCVCVNYSSTFLFIYLIFPFLCSGPNEYELYLRPDLFTKRYTQWFYFRVQNTENSGTYRFTIVNFYKSTSLFGQGMKPLMYSEKMAKLTGIGWRRVGSDISYYQTKFMEPVENKLQPRSKSDYRGCTTYSLTWKFNFPYPNDAVYFAACYPYTYTQLQEYLSQLAVNSTTKRICEQTILCYTLANNPVPLLTITEPCKDEQQFDQKSESTDHSQSTKDQSSKKRCVVITARVHPGETQGSWMMKGLMDFLISEDPDAQILRSNFVFKLVPMLNPDGVIVGNYRCSLSGCDLNRKYTSDLKRFFPTIWHTKQMIIDVMKQYEVVVYCDLHGHSRKQQVFIYGCKNQTPENRFCSRIFPAMLGKNIPELFNFDKCKFSVQKEKEGTGRIVMWREGIMNSYTLEATFCGTAGDDLEAGYHFNSFDFEKIGSHFCDTLLDYIDPDHQRLNASDEDLLTSDDSMSDSSDTGSDSSNCDELPAYYAYLLQKPKKKIKRKSRTLNAKRDEKIKSINKKEVGTTKEGSIGHCAPFLHRFTTLLRDKVCPVCGTYACQKGLKVVEESLKMRKQTHEKSESKKAFQERNNQLWKPLEGQQSGYVSDGVIPPDLISLKPYYDDINKVDHCVGIPVYQYSASSYGTLNRGHSGSKYQKFKRKENLKHVYDFTYQNLELPKIDIGSECFTNRLIHVRRARSAPSEHILITNKRFDLPHFNTDGESVHFNSYGNRIISTEDTNGYITGFPNLSDVYFKDQLTSSHIPTIKNSCSHQKSQTNCLQDESPSQLFDRKQLISNKLYMNNLL